MNYFDENKKLFSLKGTLGRRDFLINCLYIEVLENLFYLTPLFISMFFNPEMWQVFTGEIRPLWFLIIQCIVALISASLYYPSIVRRVRDIIGEEDDNRIFMISTTIAVIIIMGYTPVASSFWGGWILLFTIISLVFREGKITGEKPNNEVIKFNWGAFFGTWIWGIFNKSYKTLLILPLYLTTAWVPYMLICGLRGNEWAYENYENKTDLETFHKTQSNQAKIWTVLTPILFFVCSIIITIALAVLVGIYSQKDTVFTQKIKTKYETFKSSLVNESFSKIELTDNEYKFYIDPKVWINLSKKQKSSLFVLAVDYIKKEYNIKFSEDKKIKQKQSLELSNKTKIYSSFNNELLAEFVLNNEDVEFALNNINEKGGLKKYYNILENAYRFNNNPTLP